MPAAPQPTPPRPTPPPGEAPAAAVPCAGGPAGVEAAYREALRREPGDASALAGLGVLCHRTGRAAEAEELLRRAAAAAPGRGDVLAALAGLLGGRGRHAEALGLLRRAVELAPGDARAWNNLGVALEQAGRLGEALAALGRAVALGPGYALAMSHRGNVLRRMGRGADAAAAYREALAADPGCAAAHRNLASALCEAGRAVEAVRHYRRAADLRPGSPADGSRLLFALHYLEGPDRPDLFREHLRWAAAHAPAHPPARAATAGPAPRRPLRVGYVSPDFRRHPVAGFFEPLLAAHDRGQFHVVCYSAGRDADATTARLRRAAAGWRDVAGLPDAAAADLIRADRIDVLVDLAGHGQGNRLPLLARRPAPVQVTYLGYPDTTGVPAIDYRLTDALADPPGLTERFHTERLRPCPRCAWCYRPPDDAPAAEAPPAPGPGRPVRFGSFNNPAKLTPRVAGLWARVLGAVPGSRLVLKWRGLTGRGPREWLAGLGLPPDRLDLLDAAPTTGGHLRAYRGIDVALDPFPYHGTATTCDALWMGVPVVTLAGDAHVSRVGVSLLTAVGLPELIAETPERYVEIAAGLAGDPPALAALRAGLRARVAASPLSDAAGLAAAVESAYRGMWAGRGAGA